MATTLAASGRLHLLCIRVVHTNVLCGAGGHSSRGPVDMRVFLLALSLASVRADSIVDDIPAFRAAVRPLIREYIFGRYDKFAASELTFRDLKEHVSEVLNVPYDALKADEVSGVIEDENDKIANRCDGGKVSRTSCMTRFGMQPAKDEV
jgi:hypothetical protein